VQPLLDHERPREQVTEALSLRGEQGRDQGGRAGEHPDLDHGGQCAQKGLPEPLRAAVVADDPQAERDLAQGPAAAERLEDHRIADQDQDRGGQRDRGYRRVVQVGAGCRRDAEQDAAHRRLHQDVDDDREQPAGEPGAWQVDDDGFATDHFVHCCPLLRDQD
jgi:hypothetical protein